MESRQDFADEGRPEPDILSRDAWSRALESCPSATFFHTPLWADIVEKGYGPLFRTAPSACRAPDGRLCFVPFMETEHEGKGFFRALHAGALGVYGGPLLPETGSFDSFRRVLSGACSVRTKYVYVYGNPYAAPASGPDPVPGETFSHFTQTIPLSEARDEADLLKNYSESVRKRIRKAEGVGYVVRPAESMDDVRAVESLYRARLADWGDRATNNHPSRLFEAIFRLGKDMARIWVVQKDGETVAGNVSFYFRKVCMDWLHVCRKEHMPFNLSQYFTHWMIRDAWSRGFATYDFLPSGGHGGVVAFKQSFGTVQKPFQGFRWDNNKFYRAFKKLRGWTARLLLLAWLQAGTEMELVLAGCASL